MKAMRSLTLTLFAGGLVVAAACGEPSTSTAREISTVATAVVTVPSTAAPTTVTPSTTTTAAATTTVAPTTAPTTSVEVTTTLPATTVAVIPSPVPPPNANAVEPMAELGSIEIPKIGLTHSMFEGVTLSTLNHGPGHWPGTAEPGQVGNMVIAGHRVSHDHPFEDIDQLAPGDEVIVNNTVGRFVYQVTSTEIVTPDSLWIIDQTADRTATLFACHPKGSTRQRIVVHLAFVDSPAA